MDRGNHYEAAFEAYLHWHRLCFIAINESKRSILDAEPVKSLDFIVYGDNGSRLLVDVKGRRYPMGPAAKPRRVWESWSTQADVDGLARWAERFGPSYVGLLVFVYHIQPGTELADADDLWTWRGRRYLLRAVSVDEYRQHMRIRSPKWGTVNLPGAVYRQLARPFHHFTHDAPAASEECPF